MMGKQNKQKQLIKRGNAKNDNGCNHRAAAAWSILACGAIVFGGFFFVLINRMIKEGEACQLAGTQRDKDGQVFPTKITYICDETAEHATFSPNTTVALSGCGNITEVQVPALGKTVAVYVRSVGLYSGICEGDFFIEGGISESPSVTPFRVR